MTAKYAAIALIAAVTTVGLMISPVPDMVTDAFAAERADAENVTLEIDGLDCGSCSTKLRKALKTIDGVLDAQPGSKKSHVVVRYDPDKTDGPTILEAVTKEGLNARIVKP